MFHFQDNCFQSGFISTPEPVAQSTDTWRRKGIRTQVPQFFKITSLTLDFHELLLDSGSALLRRYPIISPLHCKSTWSKDEVNSKNLRAPEGLWGALWIEEWNYEQCTYRCKIVNDLHITHWQETLENCHWHVCGLSTTSCIRQVYQKGGILFPLYKAFLATFHFFSYHIFQILSLNPS